MLSMLTVVSMFLFVHVRVLPELLDIDAEHVRLLPDLLDFGAELVGVLFYVVDVLVP